jgi:hypothetical protein
VKENGSGMKTYQTSSALISVPPMPPARPPSQALKKATGKNRNQT